MLDASTGGRVWRTSELRAATGRFMSYEIYLP